MNIGDFFSIVGYDIVASATCDHGTVLVLNNNSTHYIVAETESGGEDLDGQGKHTVLYNPLARVAALFPYGVAGAPVRAGAAYAAALAGMTEVALRNISDSDDDDTVPEGDDAPACPRS